MAAAVLFAAAALACCCSPAASQPVSLTVRSDGSGQFTSIQTALDSLSPGRNPGLGHVTLLTQGVFRERVHVYSNFTAGVTLIGTGAVPLDSLIIYNMSGTAVGTFASWTMMIEARNVTLLNVAVANNADNYDHRKAGQSVALHIAGGKSAATTQYTRVLNSSLLGGQDTLYTGGTFSIGYYGNVFINGSVDSIFGESSAVFDSCDISMVSTRQPPPDSQTTRSRGHSCFACWG